MSAACERCWSEAERRHAGGEGESVTEVYHRLIDADWCGGAKRGQDALARRLSNQPTGEPRMTTEMLGAAAQYETSESVVERAAGCRNARCGWCGAYEGTVDPTEPCAKDATTGEYIGPHEFVTPEPRLADPEVVSQFLADFWTRFGGDITNEPDCDEEARRLLTECGLSSVSAPVAPMEGERRRRIHEGPEASNAPAIPRRHARARRTYRRAVLFAPGCSVSGVVRLEGGALEMGEEL